MHELPKVREGVRLLPGHFPCAACAFVYRNWETVPPERMAEVLGCAPERVTALARRMGLPDAPDGGSPVWRDWAERGYITLIRANWHLLNYRQLLILLGWNEEKLSYTLREDDFLSIKLGRFKPDAPGISMDDVAPEMDAALDFIRDTTLEARERIRALGEGDAAPFGFRFTAGAETEPPDFDRAAFEARTASRRIIYSYCAIYGDTFGEGGKPELSFPDELLATYAAAGVTGVWTQAVLYTLAPFPFSPELSKGWEGRLVRLRELSERLARFGLRLYLYLNEPRALPDAAFERFPDCMGDDCGDGNHCLCVSAEPVKRWLRESAALIARSAPELGGFITITASENRTNCYSHRTRESVSCPRCRERAPEELYAEVNRLLYEGACGENPSLDVIAWTWGWKSVEAIKRTIDLLPKGVAVMNVAEQDCRKLIGGVETNVRDYSISVPGPGEWARAVWKHASETGHRVCAKLQINNTWECAAVPFIPAAGQIAGQWEKLGALGVSDCMLGWTLGGFPSPMLALLGSTGGSAERMPAVCRELFGARAEDVRRAFALFSRAFDFFPFHIATAYNAPQNVGPSNLLWPAPTGLSATMVCYPYDDLSGWRSIFPKEVYEEAMRLLSEGWEEGLAPLAGAEKLAEPDKYRDFNFRVLADSAEALFLHFRSTYLQTVFVRRRNAGEDATSIAPLLEEEGGLALRLAALMSRNACIGYEPSNHYFYTRAALLEKYLNTRALER